MGQQPLPQSPYLVTTPSTLSGEQVVEVLQTGSEGLSTTEATKRQQDLGPNKLPEEKKLRVINLFISQFANSMVLLMTFAAVLSFIFGHASDTLLILSLVVINAIMGFVQEFRAEQSIQALKKMLVTKVQVKRDGNIMEIIQEDLVPGDVIFIQAGDKVPADARLLTTQNCLINEAPLTGESLPVEKHHDVITKVEGLADQKNMVWMGTTVMDGTAEAVVTAIGSATQFGQIATELKTVGKEKEHFYILVDRLSKQMATIAVGSALVTFAVGFFIRQFSLSEISVYTIATLVSALPEGLPIILVIVLAVGAQRMARKNAIVRKLSATETLGVVSVIVTDKTGTLTQNSMFAKKVYVPLQADIDISNDKKDESISFVQENEPLLLHENETLKQLITIAGSCHQVRVSDKANIVFETLLGDPTEKALFLLANKAGYHDLPTTEKPQIKHNVPFQQELRLRACLVEHPQKQQLEVFFLGAPESILDRCSSIMVQGKKQQLSQETIETVTQKVQEYSSQGLRVLGLALLPDIGSNETEVSDTHLQTKEGIFVGLAGLYDPPRPEVKAALLEAHRAGIKVVMATGDHPQTALAIAKEIGLVPQTTTPDLVLTDKDISALSETELKKQLNRIQILARLSPTTKLKIAQHFQQEGKIVAMTGDGVNDAPALKKADVGIAMGKTGTEVARETSKIVLADDNFASIIEAIKVGRTQFSNLRRTSYFLIITNVAESAALLFALGLGLPLPLLPIQILWLNVITGGLTDFALALEPTHEDTMDRPPRNPKENILSVSVLPFIGSITVGTIVLSLFIFTRYLSQGEAIARTAVFTVIAITQLLNMFNLRSINRSVFKLGLLSNKPLGVVFCLSLGLLLAALWFPPLQKLLHFAPLPVSDFLMIAELSFSVFFVGEVAKKLQKLLLPKMVVSS